jgi:hypothetical protein
MLPLIHAKKRPSASPLAWAVAVLAMVLGWSGCQTTPEDDYEPVIAEFYVEVPPQVSGAVTMQLPRSGVQVVVSPRPLMAGADVRNVELVKVDLGLCLMFEFTPDGARTLLRVSGSNLGRRLVVTLNGKPFGARLLDGPITDGRLLTFVELSDDELTETAVNLKRTALEVQTALAEGKGKKK